MKVGEIWQDKETKEKVKINYIVYESRITEETAYTKFMGEFSNDGYFVGYTYLDEPIYHDTPKVEDMIVRSWFVKVFEKCQL